MKMTTAHFAQLLNIITARLDHLVKKSGYDSREAWIESYRECLIKEGKAKDVDKRTRWDLLWFVPSSERTPLFDELYEYLNDDHVDTALKKIYKELTAGA